MAASTEKLGVALGEMGLFDGSDRRVQKVWAAAMERGHPFTQDGSGAIRGWPAVFVEKGVPEAAVKSMRSIEGRHRRRKQMAIYYELASAHESAGNKKAALSNFMEVYRTDIDYPRHRRTHQNPEDMKSLGMDLPGQSPETDFTSTRRGTRWTDPFPENPSAPSEQQELHTQPLWMRRIIKWSCS